MAKGISLYILLFSFVFATGCAHIISADLRAKVDQSLTFNEVQKNPEAYKGKIVLWGGGIIQTLPQKDGTTLIEVLEWPLGWRGEPRRTVPFQGKFLILVKEPLGSFQYDREAKITVAGEIERIIPGEKIESVSDPTYRYPLLLSKEFHLWRGGYQFSTPYDPRRYDPFYDPHRGAGILRY
jgi:outer membrane lipoprotein